MVTDNHSTLTTTVSPGYEAVVTEIPYSLPNLVFTEGIKIVQCPINLCYLISLTLPRSLKRIMKNDVAPTAIDKIKASCATTGLLSFLSELQEYQLETYETVTFNMVDSTLTVEGAKDCTIVPPIPDEYRGAERVIIRGSFTDIAPIAFEWMTNLQSVVIDAPIKRIWHGAFRHCRSLTSINLPNTLQTMHEECFHDACSLVNLHLPNSLNYLRAGSLSGLSSLESITIPRSVRMVGARCLSDCHNLKSIDIKAPIKSIPALFLAGCESISYLEIPETVNTVSKDAFKFCRSLKQIAVPEHLLKLKCLQVVPYNPILSQLKKLPQHSVIDFCINIGATDSNILIPLLQSIKSDVPKVTELLEALLNES